MPSASHELQNLENVEDHVDTTVASADKTTNTMNNGLQSSVSGTTTTTTTAGCTFFKKNCITSLGNFKQLGSDSLNTDHKLSALFLGEGNFSFTHSLLRVDDDVLQSQYFGRIVNLNGSDNVQLSITATSYDSEHEVCEKYPEFVPMRDRARNKFDKSQFTVRHHIDAVRLYEYEFEGNNTIKNNINSNSESDSGLFDYICWNHPHLGTEDCRLHALLLRHFFHSAKSKLKTQTNQNPCSIIITLVEGQAERWKIVEVAEKMGFYLSGKNVLDTSVFPGYECKRNKTGKSFKNINTKRQWVPGKSQVAQSTEMISFVYRFRLKSSHDNVDTSQSQSVYDADIVQRNMCVPASNSKINARKNVVDKKNINNNNIVNVDTPEVTITTDESQPQSKANSKSDNSTISATDFTCTICDKSFRSAQGLQTHNRQVHELKVYQKKTNSNPDSESQSENLTCFQCSPHRDFGDSEALWQHKLAKHSTENTTERDKPDWKNEIGCIPILLKEEEGESEKSSQEFKPNNTKSDDILDEETSSLISSLKQQGVTRIFPHEYSYSCPVCDLAVPLNWSLDKHLTMLQPLLAVDVACEYCGKKFIEHRALKQHMTFCKNRIALGKEKTEGEKTESDAPKKHRLLELFCGVGGMRYALEHANIEIDEQNSLAIDINNSALDIYRWNFEKKKSDSNQKTVLTNKHSTNRLSNVKSLDITTASIETFQGPYDIWTMSPPCQPFTRQGKQLGHQDDRCDAFNRIARLFGSVEEESDSESNKEIESDNLAAAESEETVTVTVSDKSTSLSDHHLPRIILLENVQNFEISQAYKDFTNVLRKRGYDIQGYMLSPHQFGFPNSRTRFYMVAVLRRKDGDESSRSDSNFKSESDINIDSDDIITSLPGITLVNNLNEEKVFKDFSESVDVYNLDFSRPETHCPHGLEFKEGMKSIGDFLESESMGKSDSDTDNHNLIIPDSTLCKRAALTLDLVYPQCQHSTCITKAYSRFYNGTGSVVVIGGDHSESDSNANSINLKSDSESGPSDGNQNLLHYSNRLRFFSPLEAFRLLGFPKDKFSLNSNVVTNKQAWACAGNSLNPIVVGEVVKWHMKNSTHRNLY